MAPAPAKGSKPHSAQEMWTSVHEMLLRHKTFPSRRAGAASARSGLKDEHFREELITFIRLVRTMAGFSFGSSSKLGESSIELDHNPDQDAARVGEGALQQCIGPGSPMIFSCKGS